MPAENSVTTPAGVIRPIRFAPYSVNQRLPSGPAVIPAGTAVALMPAENVGDAAVGVMRPIRPDGGPDGPAPDAVNQMLPSGPAAMSPGPNAARGADRELGHRAPRGDPPDPVADVLGEPQVAVGAGGDRSGVASPAHGRSRPRGRGGGGGASTGHPDRGDEGGERGQTRGGAPPTGCSDRTRAAVAAGDEQAIHRERLRRERDPDPSCRRGGAGRVVASPVRDCGDLRAAASAPGLRPTATPAAPAPPRGRPRRRSAARPRPRRAPVERTRTGASKAHAEGLEGRVAHGRWAPAAGGGAARSAASRGRGPRWRAPRGPRPRPARPPAGAGAGAVGHQDRPAVPLGEVAARRSSPARPRAAPAGAPGSRSPGGCGPRRPASSAWLWPKSSIRQAQACAISIGLRSSRTRFSTSASSSRSRAVDGAHHRRDARRGRRGAPPASGARRR